MLLEKIPELVGEEETAAEGGYGSGAAARERTFSWQARCGSAVVVVVVDGDAVTKKVWMGLRGSPRVDVLLSAPSI